MPLVIRCGKCGKQYKVDESLAGKRVKCANCATPIAVPVPAAVTAPAMDDPPPLADIFSADFGLDAPAGDPLAGPDLESSTGGPLSSRPMGVKKSGGKPARGKKSLGSKKAKEGSQRPLWYSVGVGAVVLLLFVGRVWLKWNRRAGRDDVPAGGALVNAGVPPSGVPSAGASPPASGQPTAGIPAPATAPTTSPTAGAPISSEVAFHANYSCTVTDGFVALPSSTGPAGTLGGFIQSWQRQYPSFGNSTTLVTVLIAPKSGDDLTRLAAEGIATLIGSMPGSELNHFSQQEFIPFCGHQGQRSHIAVTLSGTSMQGRMYAALVGEDLVVGLVVTSAAGLDAAPFLDGDALLATVRRTTAAPTAAPATTPPAAAPPEAAPPAAVPPAVPPAEPAAAPAGAGGAASPAAPPGASVD